MLWLNFLKQILLVRLTLTTLLVSALCPPTGICFCDGCDCDKSYSASTVSENQPALPESFDTENSVERHCCSSLSCHAAFLAAGSEIDGIDDNVVSPRMIDSDFKRSSDDCACFCAAVDTPPAGLPSSGTVFESLASMTALVAASLHAITAPPFDFVAELLLNYEVALSVRLHLLHGILRI